MERKDPKDMTVSELLRWVANGEADESGNVVVHRKLLSALSGKEYDDSTATEDARNIRAIADKIDAEIEAARCNRLADVVDSCIEMHGYPSRCEGERFDRWLERCFIQRPLDENGEPVRFGDRDIDWESLGEYRDQGIQWDVSAVDARGHILATTADPYKIVAVAKTGERGRVKRTAPEVLGADGLPVVAGETVWDTESGKELSVCAIANAAAGLIQCSDDTGYCEYYNARQLTHTPPVMAGDGKLLLNGEAVWLTDETAAHAGGFRTEGRNDDYSLRNIGGNDRLTVKAARALNLDPKCLMVDIENEDGEGGWCPASWLTHEEPDTQERIDADAMKLRFEYWGCGLANCEYCSVKIDGKKPKDWYGTDDCGQAKALDLLRRQRELDARKGGAE